jgi:hypothetical protein
VEEVISKLNFTMVEVDSSGFIQVVLSAQPCYRFLETMLQIFISASLSFIFSKVWHCMIPSALYSFWVVLTLNASLLACWNILLITGDGQIAVPFAMMSFLFFLGLFHFIPNAVIPMSTMDGLTQYLMSLLKQLSANPPKVSTNMLEIGVRVVICAILALTTAAMTTTARRYGQLLAKMTVGRPFEKANPTWKIPLWLDYAAPLPVIFVFTSGLEKVLSPSEEQCVDMVCPANTSVLPRRIFIIQVIALLFFLSIKLLVFQKHVQSFLDYSVETLSLSIVSRDLVVVNKLKRVIEVLYVLCKLIHCLILYILLRFIRNDQTIF